MPNSAPIVEAEVADYLKKHPDFFSKHLDILSSLNLPHQSGQAVSLVERQMQVLRQSNNDLKAQFSQLMDMASQNESHFENTKNLIIDLIYLHLNGGDLEALNQVFSANFPKALAANVYQVILIDADSNRALPKNITSLPSQSIQEHAPKYLNMEKSFCGAVTKVEKE